MGPTRIFALYEEFQQELPGITAKAELTLADIEPLTAFNDWYLQNVAVVSGFVGVYNLVAPEIGGGNTTVTVFRLCGN